MFLNTATPFGVRLPRSWPVLTVTMGPDPAEFAGVCAELAGIEACHSHKTQASVPSTLIDFIALPFF
jgi:hypothetical protein